MLHFFGKRLRELHEKKRDERGFTLIELLVVIIIIGVLAAIAIPTFLAQREKAWHAAAASELRNAAAAATSCAQENNGGYTGTIDCGVATNLDNFGWNDDEDVTQSFAGTDVSHFDGTAFHVSDPTCVYAFTTAEAAARAGQVWDQGDPDC